MSSDVPSFISPQPLNTSTHLESASILHYGAAASMLDQSELHGSSFANANHLQMPGRGGKHSPSECHTHLGSATILHRGAAARLARSVGARWHLRRKGKTLAEWCLVAWRQALSARVPPADDKHTSRVCNHRAPCSSRKACSTSWSSIAAPLQRPGTPAGACSRRQALSN